MNDAAKERAEKGIHDAFVVSIIAKGVFAILETVLGVALFFTNSITSLVVQLVNNELIEDPSDFLATWVHPFLHPTQSDLIFGGLYLVSHGVVKLFLVAGLLRNKIWAYPASMGVFALFIIYQLFRYFAKTHSVWLLSLRLLTSWLFGSSTTNIGRSSSVLPFLDGPGSPGKVRSA